MCSSGLTGLVVEHEEIVLLHFGRVIIRKSFFKAFSILLYRHVDYTIICVLRIGHLFEEFNSPLIAGVAEIAVVAVMTPRVTAAHESSTIFKRHSAKDRVSMSLDKTVGICVCVVSPRRSAGDQVFVLKMLLKKVPH